MTTKEEDLQAIAGIPVVNRYKYLGCMVGTNTSSVVKAAFSKIKTGASLVLKGAKGMSVAARYTALNSFIYSRALYLLRKAMTLATKISIDELTSALGLHPIAEAIIALASHLERSDQLKESPLQGEREAERSASKEVAPQGGESRAEIHSTH